jgi:hypothetical protein
MPALAHAPVAGAGQFYGGLLHLLTDLEAMPSIVALRLLAGRAGNERGAVAAVPSAPYSPAGASDSSPAGIHGHPRFWRWRPLRLRLPLPSRPTSSLPFPWCSGWA